MVILNEKQYAADCLRDGYVGDKPYQTINVIAKYLYHSEGYTPAQISQTLAEFLRKNYPRYKAGKKFWEDAIEKVCRKVKDSRLHEVTNFWVTQSEIDTIKNLQGKALQRLAFTLLCYAKIYDLCEYSKDYWVNEEMKNIFKAAHINCTVKKRAAMVRELVKLGLVEMPSRIDNLSVRITFVDENSTGVINVDDIRELGLIWLKHCGENIVRCVECGVLMKDNKEGTRRYCDNCLVQDSSGKKRKRIRCVECGRLFYVSNKDHQTTMCPDCYGEHKKIMSRESTRRWRENMEKEQ